MTERWYQTLRDDSAGIPGWMKAAAAIVQPGEAPAPIRASSSAGPMKREALRSKREPSVSELLARRALDTALAPRQRTTPDGQLHQACELALMLLRWDPKAAIPVIRTLMAECFG